MQTRTRPIAPYHAVDRQRRLIESGLRLVHYCARRTRRRFFNLDYEDLAAAGMEALVFCANRYRDDQPTRFTTYAYPRICGAILECAVAQLPTNELLRRASEDKDMAVLGSADLHDEFFPRPHRRVQLRRNMVRVGRTLARLSKRHRELIVRHYWFGLPLSEIASDMGRSRSWASRIHSEALDELRDLPLAA